MNILRLYFKNQNELPLLEGDFSFRFRPDATYAFLRFGDCSLLETPEGGEL